MTYLTFVPLATFAVVALLVPIILACVALAEKRRLQIHAQRRRRIFRPTVIQGGKVENPEAVPPIPVTERPDAEVKSSRFRIRLN